MDIEDFKARYPEIEVEELFPLFPRIPMSEYPELRQYSWEDCHRGFMGAGGLFLVSEVAGRMGLKQGMRVLDLCSGNCVSSLFLARHFGAKVVALDRDIDPARNEERIEAAGLQDAITPLKMDARSIELPEEHFDAVFCLNSYFYFGTDDTYLPYLARFIRSGGRIGIASPCYSRELSEDTPREFLYDPPDFKESSAVHSPPWWRRHFESTGVARVLACEDHRRGREFWLDQVRWLLEECHPRDMEPWMRQTVFQEIVMLLKDKERFVTYMTLIAEKVSP